MIAEYFFNLLDDTIMDNGSDEENSNFEYDTED